MEDFLATQICESLNDEVVGQECALCGNIRTYYGIGKYGLTALAQLHFKLSL